MTSLPEKPPAIPTDGGSAEEFIPLDADISETASEQAAGTTSTSAQSPQLEQAPPLPAEKPPPLPNGPVPGQPQDDDDGWEPVWDENAGAFYFYNRFTSVTQWDNPRVPEERRAAELVDNGPPGVTDASVAKKPVAGGYDPAIHGDYDPNADYAKAYHLESEQAADGVTGLVDPAQPYAATGTFNRFTGKWQSADVNPEKFNDENKSKRQMNAFFDVDAAANNHDGRSLKAERSSKKLSRKELKAFREKRREKKEEKRRAWLRD